MASLSQGYDAKVDVVYQVVKNLLCKLRSRNNRRACLARGKINKISAYRDIERHSSVIHCTRSRQTTLPVLAALGDRILDPENSKRSTARSGRCRRKNDAREKLCT